jgi:hypothetical protein
MNFLFSTKVNLDEGKECMYKVYVSKLIPTEYRAELVTGDCLPLIFLYRENGHWRTIRKTNEVNKLAAILGKEIEKSEG